jgi:molecular chaperone DnaJ
MTGKDFAPYAILVGDKNASDEDIKKTYKSRSKELHPDHGGNSEKFSSLEKPLDILMDPDKRNLTMNMA